VDKWTQLRLEPQLCAFGPPFPPLDDLKYKLYSASVGRLLAELKISAYWFFFLNYSVQGRPKAPPGNAKCVTEILGDQNKKLRGKALKHLQSSLIPVLSRGWCPQFAVKKGSGAKGGKKRGPWVASWLSYRDGRRWQYVKFSISAWSLLVKTFLAWRETVHDRRRCRHVFDGRVFCILVYCCLRCTQCCYYAAEFPTICIYGGIKPSTGRKRQFHCGKGAVSPQLSVGLTPPPHSCPGRRQICVDSFWCMAHDASAVCICCCDVFRRCSL